MFINWIAQESPARGKLNMLYCICFIDLVIYLRKNPLHLQETIQHVTDKQTGSEILQNLSKICPYFTPKRRGNT